MTMARPPSIQHCAIYTRKSTEEGLEQEFNSLDAQHEACAAYIASQASLGWKALSKNYGDGGISGGTMERPALQELLGDIREGKVDVVVVYKIDRLTRSLTDFTKIVEVFDARKVSFVSVTQQFNTTTSMGRLTLNVLLSFAQFEREVTAERIRDKISASKQKGMWMGGAVPLGYVARDKKLVVDPAGAEVVRTVFRLYLELGSVRNLKERLDQWAEESRAPDHQQVESDIGEDKPFSYAQGADPASHGRIHSLYMKSARRSFSRGHLYWILSNPVYAGDIQHKKKVFPGQHEAVIDRELWEGVQRKLKDQTPRQARSSSHSADSMLSGLVFDETGDRLTPSHAVKRGSRYRYYVSQRLIEARKKDPSGWRLPGQELERRVLQAIISVLQDSRRLHDLLWLNHRNASEIAYTLKEVADLEQFLRHDASDKLKEVVRTLVRRVDLAPGNLRVVLSREGLLQTLGIQQEQGGVERDMAPDSAATIITVPIEIRRRGREAKIVIGSDQHSASKPDPALLNAVVLARQWLKQLTAGRYASISDLARTVGVDDGEISRLLPLAFLAPSIVEAIIRGGQPVDLTARRLKRLKPLPVSWAEQRRALGFQA